jgi:hypothetical protein
MGRPNGLGGRRSPPLLRRLITAYRTAVAPATSRRSGTLVPAGVNRDCAAASAASMLTDEPELTTQLDSLHCLFLLAL